VTRAKEQLIVLNHTLVQQQHAGRKMFTVCETAELMLISAVLFHSKVISCLLLY